MKHFAVCIWSWSQVLRGLGGREIADKKMKTEETDEYLHEKIISGGITMSKNQHWPENCLWPEPIWDGEGWNWDPDDVDPFLLDEEGKELLDIRDYMDEQVAEGRLNDDYSLNEEYEDLDQEDTEDPWVPEKGEEYWEDDRFDLEYWEDEFSQHMNLLKIEACDPETDPIIFIRGIIGYVFVNENLLRQAFTRRAFQVEYGLRGCSEELEFLGDSVMNTMVTQLITRQLLSVDITLPEAPYHAAHPEFDEGVLTRIRTQYISKEYLARRATELELDRYILYGSSEMPTESSQEDMIEALIGAVALDSDWNWKEIEKVVDQLLCVQLTYPDQFLNATYYDLVNAWHQRHFGRIPSYEITGHDPYYCTLRYSVPENDRGMQTYQRIDVKESSRSYAREAAAREAYYFLMRHGLWMNLKEAGVEPRLDDSINQLQELYQKKYLSAPAQYEFELQNGDEWHCECRVDGVAEFGRGGSKTAAKKKAAFKVLVHLMMSAGICRDEWRKEMWKME